MANRSFLLFLKIGEKIHMEKLLYEGEVFCKTIQYFTEAEIENLRHDKYDGAASIQQLRNIEVFTEDGIDKLGIANSGQLYFHSNKCHGNIYCLYGVGTETLNLDEKIIRPFNLNMDSLNFGDFAVVILQPAEFIKRLKSQIESQGFTFQFSPVTYYDEAKHNGMLSPFHKSQNFANQNEIRFWIQNDFNKDLVFRIGDISDIAKLLPKGDIGKLGYKLDDK